MGSIIIPALSAGGERGAAARHAAQRGGGSGADAGQGGGSHGAPPGRAWQISPATSSEHIVKPRFLTEMTSYDITGNIKMWATK
jgi:hypothetical protein